MENLKVKVTLNDDGDFINNEMKYLHLFYNIHEQDKEETNAADLRYVFSFGNFDEIENYLYSNFYDEDENCYYKQRSWDIAITCRDGSLQFVAHYSTDDWVDEDIHFGWKIHEGYKR